jgi:hypothetical protein
MQSSPTVNASRCSVPAREGAGAVAWGTPLAAERLSRRRLGSHPLFGRLADVPFAAIQEKASAS